jgi:predicted nucleic acid-binding Zn ribbon protein
MPIYDLQCERCGKRRSDVITEHMLARGERVQLNTKCRCGSRLYLRCGGIPLVASMAAHWSDQCGTGSGRLLKD